MLLALDVSVVADVAKPDTCDDVIAIGDSETDLPLFKLAQISVALGNSSENVKSHASITVSGKAGDGVIEALDLLVSKIWGNDTWHIIS